MEPPDAGVCRTCLSPKAQLIEMQQAVPNLELMTYSDILDFCINTHDPGVQRSQLSTKYPSHICLRCSKALEVSYHFLKMVCNTGAILQEQQQELRSEDQLQYETKRNDFTALWTEDEKLLLQEQKVAVLQKQQNNNMPTALVSGIQKDHNLEDSQTLKPFTNNESPSKALWDDNDIKSEFQDFDWMDSESYGLSDDFIQNEYEDSTEIISAQKDDLYAVISKDQYFTDSEAADIKTKVCDSNVLADNLPKNVFATEMNVPYEKPLKPVEIAKCIDKAMLNDFLETLKENYIYDESEVERREEEAYLSDDDKFIMKTMKNLVCGLCNETFTDIKNYSRHVNSHKGIVPVRCNHCNFFSCYPESMRKHYKKIHCIEPTNIMLHGPINPHRPPQQERKYHAKTYQCSKCIKESHNRRDIKLHLLSKHHELNNADVFILSKYNCPECFRSFEHQRGMRIHFVRAHGKRKNYPPDSDATFQCQACAKVFPLKQILLTHQRICEGPCLIHCNLCNKNHDSVRQFEQHLCKDRAVNMMHECDICGKTFKAASYLSAHRRRHTERRYQCQLCPKKYVNNSELQVHIDCKHNTETKALCGACGATFTSLINLRAHEAKEHYEKLHKCSHCGFKAATISRLKLHQYKHVGMPYKCTICGKGFPFRIFMRRHSLTAHQITLSDMDLADMFRQNKGYVRRYDAFLNSEYSLDIPKISDEDIEKALSEFGLNIDNIISDIFNE